MATDLQPFPAKPTLGQNPYYDVRTAYDEGLEANIEIAQANAVDALDKVSEKENTLTPGTNITIDRTDPDNPVISASGGGGGGSSSWGSISGSLADQTDLKNALDAKASATTVSGLASDVTDLTTNKADKTDLDEKFPKEISIPEEPETTDPDSWVFKIINVARSWMNEWGAWRFRNPYSTWADAAIRFIRGQGDNTNGNAIELVDRRTGAPTDGSQILYGRHWSDGHLIRNGLNMADSIILGASDPVPANLPPGTIIVRPV